MKESDLNENKTPSDPSTNEIDDFAKKLLDRKAELVLFPDDDFTSSSLEGTMSEAQRKTAESSMLNALDQLRRERGQATIEEEERRYEQTHPDQMRSDSTEPDIPSFHSGSSAASKKTAHEDSRKVSEDRYIAVEPNRYETSKREDHFEKQEERPQQKTEFYRRPKFWLIVALIAVIAVLFGTYAWKVTVYDPAHVSDAEQESAYQRLMNFADEYSMKSDAQKRDILNLEADYNSLPEAKKSEINAYFQNPKHTGRTFTDLLNEMKQSVANEQNPNFTALEDYANQYAGLAEADKMDILNRIGPYNSLDEAQKAQINSILQASTGKDFMTLYHEASAQHADQSEPVQNAGADQTQSENQAAAQTEPAQNEQPVQTPQTDTALQQELGQLYADRDSYLQFISEEGETAADSDIISQYNAQIAELEAQLGQ